MKAMTSVHSDLPAANTMHQIETTANGSIGYFGDVVLHSVFQPIYSFAHHAPIGYEALIRATSQSGVAIPPLELFAGIDDKQELMQLEALSRTLHIINFFKSGIKDAWLFLNINPRLISDCQSCLQQLFELLNHYSISPTRIVIEFVEESVTDFNNLIRAAQYLRQNGCLIAIDDFGIGHSNFYRLWELSPDIIKLDKSMLTRVRINPRFRRTFTSLVELLHESGSLVLMEGIESEADADIVSMVNVDFHQGFFYGRPERLLGLKTVDSQRNIENIHPEMPAFKLPEIEQIPEQLQYLFRMAASGVHPNTPLANSCEGLLNYPYAIRCYVLDERGYQIGETIQGRHAIQNLDPRYRVLDKNTGANWSRRSYFQRAMATPFTIQTTRPYLSLTGAHLCVTLSMAIDVHDQLLVLCCDLKWPELDK